MSDVLKKLESLVIGNDDFLNLKGELNSFNIFEAMGGVRSELRHSSFLAFLLDPNKPHGLGAKFLENLLFKLSKEIDFEQDVNDKQNMFFAEHDFKQMIFDISLDGVEGVEVYREFKNIDILVQFEISGDSKAKYALIIENKVDAGLSLHQLEKYKEFSEGYFGADVKKVYFYLTKDGATAETDFGEYYIPISYDQINQAILNLLENNQDNLVSSVYLILKHYQHLLERHLLSDSKEIKLAQKIYKEHKDVLDFIFENIPNPIDELREQVSLFIKDDVGNSYKVCRDTRTLLNFAPVEWFEPALCDHSARGGWRPETPWIQFELSFKANKIAFFAVLGPAKSDEKREKAFDLIKERSYVSIGSKYKPNGSYTTFHLKDLRNRQIVLDDSLEEASADLSVFLKEIFEQIELIKDDFQKEVIDKVVGFHEGG